ncbi:MAG: 6-phosphofructokinase [Candidatus Bipolaricaulia bacterium]
MNRIGMLSGGGDSPGINAALRAVVRRAHEEDIETVGFREGWLGVIEDRSQPLTLKDVSGILPVGGTLLGSSRTNPFAIDGGPEKIVETYQKNGLDVVIAIGGDDTLGVAHKLSQYDLNMVGIPQTIDNDVAETEYCIGFDSAVTAVTDALDKLHTTAFSHHRILALEVMGRDSGWIGLLGGLAGGADVVLVPERKFKISEVQERIEKRQQMGKSFSIIVVSEGAKPVGLEQQVTGAPEVDAFGHVKLGGVGHYIADQLSKTMNLPVRVTTLAYLQRGGSPTAFDRILATRFGVKAVELALEGNFDKMVAIQADRIVPVELAKVIGQTRHIDQELLKLTDLFY